MGLGLSSNKKNLDFKRYEWAATHACETNLHEWDGTLDDRIPGLTGYNFEKRLELAAEESLALIASGPDVTKSVQDLLTTSGSDFGDKIGFSMWIKPMWSHSGSKTTGTWSNGSTVLPLFQINTSNAIGGDRSIIAYINFRSGTSFRNRLTVWVDGGDDRAGVQRAMHDVNSITGTGSSSTSTNSLWDQANPGNRNSEGFVHLVFTRGEQTGAAAWDVYWNAQDLGMNIDIGTGDDEPQFTNDTVNFLGIGTYRAKSSSYNSGADPYNHFLTPMRIRDFAVFPFELSSSQVTSLYNSGNFSDVRSTMAADKQPVLYYPLNHNTVDYMKNADLKGNSNSFVSLS